MDFPLKVTMVLIGLLSITCAIVAFRADSQIGPVGLRGFPGPQGPQGLKGNQGPSGPTGPIGSTGATGPTGLVGGPGPKGDTGPPGSSGPTGPTGANGPQGDPGPPGQDGTTGATGPQGDPGAPGPPGATGPTGATGPPGAEEGAPRLYSLDNAYSDDEGLTWQTYATGSSPVKNLGTLCYAVSSSAWIAGFSGGIYYTYSPFRSYTFLTNGDADWQTQTVDTLSASLGLIRCVAFANIDASIQWIASSSSKVYTSSNASDWVPVTDGSWPTEILCMLKTAQGIIIADSSSPTKFFSLLTGQTTCSQIYTDTTFSGTIAIAGDGVDYVSVVNSDGFSVRAGSSWTSVYTNTSTNICTDVAWNGFTYCVTLTSDSVLSVHSDTYAVNVITLTQPSLVYTDIQTMRVIWTGKAYIVSAFGTSSVLKSIYWSSPNSSAWTLSATDVSVDISNKLLLATTNIWFRRPRAADLLNLWALGTYNTLV